MASKTGCTSVGERLITPRISPVAVCRSSASLNSALRACSSSNNRTFSTAITAWAAKVLSSSTWVGERPAGPRLTTITPIGLPSRSIGDGEDTPEAAGPRDVLR